MTARCMDVIDRLICDFFCEHREWLPEDVGAYFTFHLGTSITAERVIEALRMRYAWLRDNEHIEALVAREHKGKDDLRDILILNGH